MGIRITRRLGWGLYDVEPKDSRIDWDAVRDKRHDIEMNEYHSHLKKLREKDSELAPREQDLDLLIEEDFFTRLFEDRATSRQLQEDNPNIHASLFPRLTVPDFYEAVTYSDEGGDASVLLITPFIHIEKWQRYADPLDYAEYDFNNRNSPDYTSPETLLLPHNPWPYDTDYIDKRTEELLTFGNVRAWYTHLTYNHNSSDDSPESSDEITQKLLGMTYLEAKENIIPAIPSSVIRVADYIGLFTDPDTWKELRPMLYTYWS